MKQKTCDFLTTLWVLLMITVYPILSIRWYLCLREKKYLGYALIGVMSFASWGSAFFMGSGLWYISAVLVYGILYLTGFSLQLRAMKLHHSKQTKTTVVYFNLPELWLSFILSFQSIRLKQNRLLAGGFVLISYLFFKNYILKNDISFLKSFSEIL